MGPQAKPQTQTPNAKQRANNRDGFELFGLGVGGWQWGIFGSGDMEDSAYVLVNRKNIN